MNPESVVSHNTPAPSLDEVWRLFKETDRQFKETDRQFKETDRRFKETDRKLNKLERLFNSQWGRLMESLVEGDLVALLNRRGIPVERTMTRTKGCHEGSCYEFDIIAKNGSEVVIVEVKTTLRPDDVKDFIAKLKRAKGWMSEYADNVLYGAVAYLVADAGAERMAQDRGLLVIRATGNSASILNPADFQPRRF